LHDGVAALGDRLLRTTPTDSYDLVIAHELALAYGRPDIVVGAIELAQWRAWRRRRVAPCTAPLPLATALALQKLGGKATTADLLRADTGQASAARARRSLATLEDLGWVRRVGDAFVLRLAPGTALITAIGVEAKLNNWRRAVKQVQSWEGHVDAAWLAFPAPYLRHVPRTSALRRFGLIGVESRHGRIVRRPSGTRARGVRRTLLEQHLYRRWLMVSRRNAARS
jgi:hypothetical protein